MVLDMHGHTVDIAFRGGRHLYESLGGVTDVPLMQAGGVHAQLSATWLPDITLSGPHSHSVPSPKDSLSAIFDYLEQELAGRAAEDVLLARTATDLRHAKKTGRVAILVGMEGTDALQGEPALLEHFYNRGLRQIGLVHEHPNEFGGASQVWDAGRMRTFDPSNDPQFRLTPRGRDLLRIMVQLRVLIDLTHMAEPAFWEVLEEVNGPVLISHGGARGLNNSTRYLSDEQLQAIAKTGGVIGASPTPLGPSHERPGLILLLDTIDYLSELIGPEHVGIGTDFKDQVDYYPPPFASSADTQNLKQALTKRGYSHDEISGICGGNALDLIDRVIS